MKYYETIDLILINLINAHFFFNAHLQILMMAS